MIKEPIKIAVFASGMGSNASNITMYFLNHTSIEVALLVTNNIKSGVVALAEEQSIPCLLITNEDLNETTDLVETLTDDGIEYLILAGFLRKIPDAVIDKFRNRILNVHPSLLPKHGGKGMYGKNVHEAVKQSGDNKTGISIHLVDEKYDHGKVLFQKEIILKGNESVNDIESQIKTLEHENYPIVIEQFILSDLQKRNKN